MRLCRFGSEEAPRLGFYDEQGILPFDDTAKAFAREHGMFPDVSSRSLLDYLPPDGRELNGIRTLATWVGEFPESIRNLRLDPRTTPLLVPMPRPNKVFLLAGNYAEHIRESGERAAERAATFPYVFMKPPSTTLTPPGKPILLPAVAPDAVDWELELAVVIGRRAKRVSEAESLACVAGYTVVNDISQRRFRPNPGRTKRDRDAFFDWLHGKWFDTFCPIGPCILSAVALPDPQTMKMKLELNGVVKQDASTAQMIFPVAALIAFISDICTLEPGDLICTGTPAGVGSTTGTFLKPGDVMRGWIEGIGELVTPVESESDA